MKRCITVAFLAAGFAAAAFAQTAAKPASPHTATRPSAATTGTKLPLGIPPAHGILKTAFSLRYQDIRIGTGAEAEPNKIYKVAYTGWLAGDGRKFDSSYDHKTPVIGKDGKPELKADGQPKLTEGQPISFPQGFGRVIPGFDQGFNGMHVGGKRRLFIPWQLAYGARGRPGPNADSGIPPKADLIFDIELIDVSDMQMPQNHPPMGGTPGQPMHGMPHPGQPGTPATPQPGAAPQPSATPQPGATTPPPSATPANPTAPPPAGTPPPASTPTTPPTEKPQSK